MLKFIVLLLLIILYFRHNSKRKGAWLTPSGFLILIYMIAATCAIFTIKAGEFKEPLGNEYWLPSMLFLFCLAMFIVPFCRFNENRVEEIILPNMKVLNAFTTVIIIISLFSIAFFASSVNNIFSLSSLGDARNALYMGESYVESGLSNTIASIGASMYVFALLLFFIYSVIGNNKVRCILLLVSSISEPLHILSYVGRDGVVFWLFSFIFLYMFFLPYMDQKLSKSIFKSFCIGAAILLTPFLLISISRFDGSDGGTGSSLIDYMGQSFVNGTLFMGIKNKPFNEGSAFPLFYELTGIKQMHVYEMGGAMLQIGEWRSWQFSTFVVSLYRNLHMAGLLILAFFCALFQHTTIGTTRKSFHFAHFFIYILFFQVFSQGVFYFKQYTRGGNLFILLCLILTFIFSVLLKPSGSNVLHRQIKD